MAKQKHMAVMQFSGRPCLIVAQRRRTHPKFRDWTEVNLRYLDGKLPAESTTSQGKFKAAKRVPAAQAHVWIRVDELVRRTGMEPERATKQALAEMAKGVLTAGG